MYELCVEIFALIFCTVSTDVLTDVDCCFCSLPGSGRSGAGKLQSCVSQPNLNLSRSMNNLSMQAPLAQHAQHAQQHGLAVRGNRNSIAVEHNVGASLASLGSMPGAHRASTSSLATAGERPAP